MYVYVCMYADYPPVVIPPAPENAMSYDGGGPRLMITRIVNENFKSYAGTETLGPFHKVSLCYSHKLLDVLSVFFIARQHTDARY